MESTDIWAVVIGVSGEKYVGKVGYDPDSLPPDINRKGIVDEILSGIPDSLIQLNGVLNYAEIKIPIPNPHNPGQIAINRTVNVSPVAFSMDPENYTIYVRVSEISFFHDMSKLDKEAHEQAVRDGYDMVMRARAQRAGIVAPDAGNLLGRTH
jgi:hypothetical protein